MKQKNSLYLLTFLAVNFVVALVGIFAFRMLYKTSQQQLFESKLEAGKREVREMGKLLELQLADGIPSEKVIQNLQNAIVNTDLQSGFICMYNTEGIELCHPNPALIGQKIEVNNSNFISEGNPRSTFSEILDSGKTVSGMRDFPENKNRNSEIVSVYRVNASNWMLASHTNIKVLETEISALYQSFLLVFMISFLLVSGLSFILIRMIYTKYERQKEEEINLLNKEIIGLSALNGQLKSLQEKRKEENVQTDRNQVNTARKRITTYHKDELISLEISDIAHFYLEENSVYILTFDKKKYTISYSLDEIMKIVDPQLFYRANRQIIIHIQSIGNILLYGKNQLKVLTDPANNWEIIISKNKVSEFKKWLEA